MSLSLIQSYGSSDSESSEEVSTTSTAKISQTKQENIQSIKLPSAAELFQSKNTSSVFCSSSIVAENVNISKSTAKPSSSIPSSATEKIDSKQSNKFVPPQLARPNIVTEDMHAFGSKRKGDNEGKKADNKKLKSYNQIEKKKRDIGQSSRGKSFVEEEKRLLRQGGSI